LLRKRKRLTRREVISIFTASSSRWLEESRNQRREHRNRRGLRVVSKLKFLGVLPEMLPRNVNMSALNTIFQASPKAFNAVSVGSSIYILTRLVVNGFVLVSDSLKIVVGLEFVRVNCRSLKNVFLDDRLKNFSRIRANYLGHNLTVTLQHPENDSLVLRVAMPQAVTLAAHIRFINFYIAKKRKFAIYLRDVLANLMSHAPRAFVRHAKLSFQFLGGNAVAGRGEEVDRIEPKLEGRAAVLERRADGRVKMMPAPLAGISAFCLNLVPVRLALALRAGMALAKTNRKNVRQAVVIRRELLKKITDRDAGLFLFQRGLRLHGINL
jgi:hypothetical protein